MWMGPITWYRSTGPRCKQHGKELESLLQPHKLNHDEFFVDTEVCTALGDENVRTPQEYAFNNVTDILQENGEALCMVRWYR